MVLNKNIIEIASVRESGQNSRKIARFSPYKLNEIAVLPETLLGLELSLGGPAVDLASISSAILHDMGATLQIFRAANRARGLGSVPLSRLEDCVAELGVNACVEVISRHVTKPGIRRNAIAEIWDHASAIAGYCAQLAEMNDLDANPSEAYLVGLFHDLGTFPALVGWDRSVWGAIDVKPAGRRIAVQCALPMCVREYFSESPVNGTTSRWSEIVALAHQVLNLHPIAHSTFVGPGNLAS